MSPSDLDPPSPRGSASGPAPESLVSGFEPEQNAESPFDRPFLSMNLQELAQKLFHIGTKYTPRFEGTEKRIRGIQKGIVIFDTTNARLVWEHKWFPQYWIPVSALPKGAIKSDAKSKSLSEDVRAEIVDIFIISPTTNQIGTVQALIPTTGPLSGYAKLNFGDLDEWLEEQAPIQGHPKDPYHRVDIIPTGRTIKVEIDGMILADTAEEGGVMSLWETHFPGRWYVPRTAVNFEYLEPSETRTSCPYKGRASYYHAILPGGKRVDDVVWWYEFPVLESSRIQGMLCFYPEKVDLWVDGVKVGKR